mmetsp:Transcript_29447/g.71088  ORF Transcript_29447/g.71088 Transcript_29447/m.71088 type:complete len:893 (+) Transcript_29447:196-2874(+)
MTTKKDSSTSPSSPSPSSSSSSLSSSPNATNSTNATKTRRMKNISSNGGQEVAGDSGKSRTRSSSTGNKNNGKNKNRVVSICGTLLSFSVHSTLFVLFLAWAAVYCIQTLYDEYFLTLIEGAKRTDEDLVGEYTYYTRECSLIDLTADLTTAHQLVIEEEPNNTTNDSSSDSSDSAGKKKKQSNNKNKKPPADRAVDSVMLHGAVMIPSLLQDSTVQKLRDFVVRKNEAVLGTAAEYPVSQGRNRISYGIEATEDDAVVEALKEIHDHTMLTDVVTKLVGPNPALSEITAITAKFGAGPQAWHSDTKADGNAVLHGRTYEHSYSIFIPLQDTTGLMGATDLCPGTHYCADDDLEYLCEQKKIGLHQIRRRHNVSASPTKQFPQPGFVSVKNNCVIDDGTYQNYAWDHSETIIGTEKRNDRANRNSGRRSRSMMHGNPINNNNNDGEDDSGVWRRGDAVLLNQQVWHRGAAHDAEGSPERIVFILSFLGRPTSDDPRQLARGTYFHMKWNMWGHTWQDLADSATSMARPWSILRALHLWKPSDRDWGYDLFTSATLRIANQQLGCDPGDLTTFVSEVMVPLGTPEFLHGTIDIDQDEAWLIYLKETIQNFNNFLQTINAVGYLVGATLLSLAAILVNRHGGNGMNILWNGIRRTLVTHGLVVVLAVFTLHSVHSSKWANDIASGKTLMRPFPIDVRSLEDPTVSEGKTTVPHRFDVLVGSRFDSPHIGMYSHWLGYHYGNRLFDDFVNAYGGRSFRSLHSNIAPCVVQAGVDLVEQRSGRFLQQDYRSGSWRHLHPLEVESYAKLQLVVGRDTMLDALLQEVNFMYDHNRFGVPSRKRMSMSWHAQRQLDDLAQRIFSVWFVKQPVSSTSSLDQPRITPSAFRLRFFVSSRIT